MPSAQLSATRLFWMVPEVPLIHWASQCCTQILSTSQLLPEEVTPEEAPPDLGNENLNQ